MPSPRSLDSYSLDQVEILVIDEDGKKRNNSQYRRGQVPNKEILLQLMRIEPDSKDVQGEEQHGAEGHIAGKDDGQEIQHEIGR